MAKRYQEHSRDTITILLLDEVGLAEHRFGMFLFGCLYISPDMPLKVLHGILLDPQIAIVGLSNWVLDPAKVACLSLGTCSLVDEPCYLPAAPWPVHGGYPMHRSLHHFLVVNCPFFWHANFDSATMYPGFLRLPPPIMKCISHNRVGIGSACAIITLWL